MRSPRSFQRTPAPAATFRIRPERAGGFEPLRFVPGRRSCSGLITTKVRRIETVDELRRRIDDAARCCHSHSWRSARNAASLSLRGNLLTEESEFRKLDVMLETAKKVWGQ